MINDEIKRNVSCLINNIYEQFKSRLLLRPINETFETIIEYNLLKNKDYGYIGRFFDTDVDELSIWAGYDPNREYGFCISFSYKSGSSADCTLHKILKKNKPDFFYDGLEYCWLILDISNKKNSLLSEKAINIIGKVLKFFPEVIYHYTSIENVCNIISSEIFYSTNVMFQNDTSEMQEAYELLENIFGKKFYNNKNVKNAFLEKYKFYKKTGFPIYTISFSTKSDDLNQWRIYGNDGKGCRIGILTSDITKKFIPLRINSKPIGNKKIKVDFENCYYDDDIKRKKIEKILQANKINLDTTKRVISLAPFFKNEVYKPECEYRLVFNLDVREKSFTNKMQDSIVHPNYKGFPIINTRVVLKTCLKDILIGPCASEESIAKLKFWLVKKKLENKLITEKSKIPYRGK